MAEWRNGLDKLRSMMDERESWRMDGFAVIGNDGPLLWTFTTDREQAESANAFASFITDRRVHPVSVVVTKTGEPPNG